jgi:hypothetical protein
MELMNITADAVFQKLTELDGAIAAEEIRARAEDALDALPSHSHNPFAGAGATLEALRAERRTAELRAEGEVLAKAIVDFEAVNQQLAGITADYQTVQAEIGRMKDDQLIERWRLAPRRAQNMGVDAAWKVLASFLSSEAPSTAKPMVVSDVYIVSLPTTLQFTDEDRTAIRRWVKLNTQASQLAQRGSDATARREHCIREHPALRSLLAT